jgi:hypothetical protein
MLLGGAHYLTMPLDPTGSFVGAEHLTTPGAGSWTLTLNYSGDANYLPTTRNVQITTGTAPLTLSCSPSTIVSGGSTSCTAQVAGVTSGTVSVYVDGALQGTSGVDQSGTVVIAIPPTSCRWGHAMSLQATLWLIRPHLGRRPNRSLLQARPSPVIAIQ